MGTSCKPLKGVKKYVTGDWLIDNYFKDWKWWYCDPSCKPKKGDWIMVCIESKRRGSINDGAIVDYLKTQPMVHNCYLLRWWSGLPSYLLIAFKKDCSLTLQELCNKALDYAGERMDDFNIYFYGCDIDYPMVWITWVEEHWTAPETVVSLLKDMVGDALGTTRCVSVIPGEYSHINVVNEGRAVGYIHIFGIEYNDSKKRFVEGTTLPIKPSETVKLSVRLVVRDKALPYLNLCVYVTGKKDDYAQLKSIYNYPSSPNSLEILGGAVPPTPKIIFPDKKKGCWIYHTPDLNYYPGQTVEIALTDEVVELACCAWVINKGAKGVGGVYIYDKKAQKYLNGITKVLEFGEEWHPTVYVDLTEGEYELVFHSVHQDEKSGKYVVDDSTDKIVVKVQRKKTAISKFVDKETECYIVDKYGNCYYPGQTIKEEGEKVVLRCCGLIKNIGNNEGECGMYVYDKKAKKYYDGATKVLKPNEMWLAIVDIVLSEGEYELEFHAVHKDESGKYVVDDTVG